MEAAEAAMARMKAGEEEEVRAMRRVMAVAAALHPASRLAAKPVSSLHPDPCSEGTARSRRMSSARLHIQRLVGSCSIQMGGRWNMRVASWRSRRRAGRRIALFWV